MMTTRLMERNPAFDVVKALMMLWVIWGHLSLYNVVKPVTSVCMLNAKIGVNMPIFFVIGGYLALSTFEKGSWSKILARIVGFLWPMAAFGVVFALALVMMGNGGGIQWFLKFTIQHVHHWHWFLWTYAAVYLLSALIYRIGRTDCVRWVGFALLYAVLLFLPSRFQHLLHWVGDKQTIHMLPYFVFGLMVLRKREWWHSNLLSLLSGAFFLSVVFLEGNSTTNGMNFWMVSTHWRAVFLNGHNLLCFFARTAVGITGSVFVLWVVDRLLRFAPRISALAVFGTTSMGVYVLHEWPIMQVGRAGFPLLPFPEWTRWFVAVVWFLACHFIVAGIRRFSSLRFMFFGDERRLADSLSFVVSRFLKPAPHTNRLVLVMQQKSFALSNCRHADMAFLLLGLVFLATACVFGQFEVIQSMLSGWLKEGSFSTGYGAFNAGYGGRRVLRMIAETGIASLLAPLIVRIPAMQKCKSNPVCFNRMLLAFTLVLGTLLRLDVWWSAGGFEDTYSLLAGLRTNNFKELLTKGLGFNQSAPIGFLLFEKTLGIFSGWNIHILKFPLLIAGLASLWCFVQVLRQAGIRCGIGLFLLPFAINPSLVYYSGEFKQYGLDVLGSVLVLLVTTAPNPWNNRERFLTIVLFALSPLFSHTQLFLLPCLGLFLVFDAISTAAVAKRRTRVLWVVFYGVLAMCSCILTYVHSTATMPERMFSFWSEQGAFPPDGIHAAFKWWIVKALRFFRSPVGVFPFGHGGLKMVLLSAVVPASAVIAGIVTGNRPMRRSATVFAGSVLLLVIATTMRKWVVVTGENTVYGSRHILFLIPFALFAVASGLCFFQRQVRFRWIFAVLFAALISTCAFRIASERMPSWSMDRCVERLVRNHHSGVPVLMGFCQTRASFAFAPDWMKRNHRVIFARGIPGQPDPIPIGVEFVNNNPNRDFWMFFDPWHPGSRGIPELADSFAVDRAPDFFVKDFSSWLIHFPPKKNESRESNSH